jgi:predicted nucleic acid-binding protein
MVLVDTNVLLDWLTMDSDWFEWSVQAIDAAHQDEGIAINAIIYAEVSVGFLTASDARRAIPSKKFHWLPLSHEAAFLAGKAYKEYRERGGVRRSPLPDFFIGAHAQAAGLALLTRDKNRYASYFPDVRLISP